MQRVTCSWPALLEGCACRKPTLCAACSWQGAPPHLYPTFPAGDASAFADQVRPLRAAAPPSTRFVFVTATIPDYMFQELEQDFPGSVAAFGPSLHRTAPGVCAYGPAVGGREMDAVVRDWTGRGAGV